MNSEASGSPQQRIITSEQWVFDRSAKDDAHADCRPRKASSSTKEERELRRRQRELENEQLQQEYNTVRQENAKLKNVIARLRQDIDVYMQLLAGSAPAGGVATAAAAQPLPPQRSRAQPIDDLPPMETMLVNTAKRRKHTTAARNAAPASASHARASGDVPVLKDTQADVMLVGPPGDGEVEPDDLALMRRLKDVLAQME